MFLSPIIHSWLRPTSIILRQTRNIRPSLKISKEKFELKLDVLNYSRDEIRVKARPEYVVIEGKQELKSKTGFVIRQFVRKFKLPNGCSPCTIKSSLTPDGILTITAPRNVCEQSFPCETVIPISYTESRCNDDGIIPMPSPASAAASAPAPAPASAESKKPPGYTPKPK